MEKKKVLLPIVIALTLIFMVAGGTFAYWRWQSDAANKTNVTFTVAADFSCSATGGGDISSANLAPASCTNSTYALQRTITTTITNNGTAPVTLDMWLTIGSIGSGLTNSSNFKWALTTDSTSCTNGVVDTGTFQGKVANDKVNILKRATTGTTYYLYIWLDSAENSSSTMNQSYSMSLGGSCTNKIPTIEDTLASEATSDENVVNFSKSSVQNNTNGLYMLHSTANDAHPVYYYRGNVDNNVIFANFCWKIVRTTSTGGTKLIYNGIPSNGQCTATGTATQLSATSAFNSTYNNAKYVGYMYDNSGTQTNSTIKTVIDNWYQSNMTAYTSQLEDTIWCNDRSVGTMGANVTLYGAYNRAISTYAPIVTCPQKDDAFTVSDTTNGNGLLTYPVGLLTADEIMMAGAKYDTGNSSYYLYTGQAWWSGSPNGWGAGYAVEFSVNSAGNLYTSGRVYSSDGVRPSVTLKPGMAFEDGEGTPGNPYIVE